MPPDTRPALTRREMLAWIARAAILAGAPLSPVLQAATPRATGYGRDPDLLYPVRTWALTLTDEQKAFVARVADLILPADAHGPAPSAIGIVEFIDEWVSAPYPRQREDREAIVPAVMRLRGRADAAILADDGFFLPFRRLCLLGYYTSPTGMRDIGHVEPVPATEFTGPPEAVRRILADYLSYKQQDLVNDTG